MTFEATVVRVLLASPGDTESERDVVRAVMTDWNATHAAAQNVILMPVGWETDSMPEWGAHPQTILNRQLVDDADALIGIFWTRLGTPTPDGASGTVEEIERVHAAGKPVMLYFCRKNPELADVDPEQLAALREFESSCQSRGLHDEYGDKNELTSKLGRSLSKLVRQHFGPPEPGLPRGRRLNAPPRQKDAARLAAHLESHRRGDHRVVIANTGTVDLHKIDVEVPEEAGSFHLFTDELPIDTLRPGERVQLLGSTSMSGGARIFDLRLRGTDGAGEEHTFFAKISL